MLIECLGGAEYEIPVNSNKFISNLKWDSVNVIVQIKKKFIRFAVNHYIKTPKDLLYIWDEILQYSGEKWATYNDNNISTILRYKCKHCLFNNTLPLYIEETNKEPICVECNECIECKFVRGNDNRCFHVNCFNKNPTILRNKKLELYQCKMCDKYANIMNCNIRYMKLFNEYDSYEDIIKSKISGNQTYIDNNGNYTLLFLTE